jgi:hypothetical protein
MSSHTLRALLLTQFLCAGFYIVGGATELPAQTPAPAAMPAATSPATANNPLLPPQPAVTNSTASGDSVQPTVTPEMGDMGGKFFGHAPDPAKTKHYYIAAEPILWNFAPEGQDPVCGKSFPPSLLINRVSWKIHYVQYADPGFSARVLPTDRLGILGPVLRGTVGQYIEVTFLNRAWLPLSMHPHGVKYDKDSEGSYYRDGSGLGAAVAPGAKYTYVWKIDQDAAPLPTEPSSKAWLYHSHVTGDEDVNLGLIGAIIVTDPARARPDGTPKDVDREMAALFYIFNEANLSGTDDEEPDERSPNSPPPGTPIQRTWADEQQAVEDGQRYTINGLVFGNLRGLEMNAGEKVRWYLFGLGSENDLHTPHWHGMTVIENGQHRTDVVELLPGSMKVADMVADNPGTWLFHCHVAEHMTNGMFARFTVYPAGSPGASRDPEVAFLGMPQSLNTLRLQNVRLSLNKKDSGKSELDLDGTVTVPDPFPVATHNFTVQIGTKTLSLKPDSSGICVAPEGILLIKNLSTYGNGIVRNGTMNFSLTLRGAGWISELRQMHLLQKDELATHATLPISLLVGNAHHTSTVSIKFAAE